MCHGERGDEHESVGPGRVRSAKPIGVATRKHRGVMKDIIQQTKDCEKQFPETSQAFKDMLGEMYDTFCGKMLDYGSGNIALGRDLSDEDNKKMALMGIWFRSNDKMARIENIVNKSNVPNHESLEDSYLDLANYSVIATIVGKNIWGK